MTDHILYYSISMWFVAMILYSYGVRTNRELSRFEILAVIAAPISIPIFIGSAIIIGFFK